MIKEEFSKNRIIFNNKIFCSIMLSFETYIKSTLWGFHLNSLVPEITSKIAPSHSSGITARELA